MTAKERIMNRWMALVEKRQEELQEQGNTAFFYPFGERRSTYYRKMEETGESFVYGVQTPKEMTAYINSVIGDELAAQCLSAKVFYDFYEYEDDSVRKGAAGEGTGVEKQEGNAEGNAVEIPAYTYTL